MELHRQRVHQDDGIIINSGVLPHMDLRVQHGCSYKNYKEGGEPIPPFFYFGISEFFLTTIMHVAERFSNRFQIRFML
jgi:hypothetical protein